MRRLAVPFMVIGLAWATAVGAAARQDELPVVSSEVSGGNKLADLFPISVGEQPLAVTTWSGTEWVARLDPEVADEAAMITATEPPPPPVARPSMTLRSRARPSTLAKTAR